MDSEKENKLKVVDLRKHREQREKKNSRPAVDLGELHSAAIGSDKVHELKFDQPELKPGMRVFWVKDIIRYLEPEIAPRIASYKPNDRYDVFFPPDPRYHELHIRAGFGESDLIPCLFGVKMGNSGCSWIEPFPTFEDAIEWLNSIKDNMYFVSSTNPEFREMFPGVLVR